MSLEGPFPLSLPTLDFLVQHSKNDTISVVVFGVIGRFWGSWHTIGTLDMRRADTDQKDEKQASRPMTKPRRPRGKSRPDSQLSRRQRDILLWLLNEERAILASRNVRDIKVLRSKGVPWLAKRFFQDMYDEPLPTKVAGSISRSLKALEGRNGKARGLIRRYDTTEGTGHKGRTSHVQLTKLGRQNALFEAENRMTRRQLSSLRRRWENGASRVEFQKFQEAYLKTKLDRKSLLQSYHADIRQLQREGRERVQAYERESKDAKAQKVRELYRTKIAACHQHYQERLLMLRVVLYLSRASMRQTEIELFGEERPIDALIPASWHSFSHYSHNYQEVLDLVKRYLQVHELHKHKGV